MKNKALIFSMIVLLVILSAFFFFTKSGKSPSDSEIREKFRCNRLTKEYLSTDKYCDDPELYRQELNK